MNDDELLTAIANGDDTALRALYDQHAPWIAARLRRTLAPASVEDVLQETFIAVWRGAGKYQPGTSPGAWLWTIARRQTVNWLRKHGEASRAASLDEVMEGGWSPRDTSDPAAAAVSRVDLERALARLGPTGQDNRELAQLVFLEDRPLREVARHFGVTEVALRARVFRLRKQLQAFLELGEGADHPAPPNPKRITV